MARPNKSSGKGSSFGKRTDAENSFRKSKGRTGSREEGDRSRSGRGARDNSKPSGPSRFKSSPDGERKSARSYGKKEDHSSEGPSRFSKSSGGFGDRENKRPYKKKEDSSEDRPRRFSKPSGTGRSFGNKDEKRPYKKRDENPSPDRPRFAKSAGPRKNDDEKRESVSFKRPRTSGKRPFGKEEERKSFVQNKIDSQNASVRPDYAEKKSDDGLIRLNKFISNSGVCSRREADELIKLGLIKVNGVTITEMGYKVKPTDDVRHEDKRLKAEKPVYVLLNKPKGFITTTDDPQERNTVMGLVASACKERIYPVGRLDRNTTGLLLLTNDGDLTDKLTHPSYNVKKIYKAELDKPLTKNDFQKIVDGVQLEEGKAIVDDIAIVSDDGLTVGIEIHIGWNRIVRRIFEALGYMVAKLDRVVYAGLDKKDLKRGQWRFLKSDEVVRLKHFK
jgi:23S rRNA pseudouridine2605 synthase